jgi:flagellar biosynthesis/type III secretory pathway M-ring protein FliF/YscJ
MIWLRNAALSAVGSAAIALGQVSLPSPNGAEFLTVLGSLLVIAVIIRTIYGIMADRRKANESDQPKRTVKIEDDLVRKKEFEKLDTDIKEMFKEHSKQSETRIQKVHERINTIAEEMPGKVIALLRDTGHLRWPGDRK